MHIQGTKPDTVGVALSSSPLGLAAYIMEKFSTWTNRDWRQLSDGGLGGDHPISQDNMITNVMIYWITNSITSSMRYYKENFSSFSPVLTNAPVDVPVGFADTPNELVRVPRFQLRGKFPKMIQYNTLEAGGHFAAMEVPQLLAKDILHFAMKVQSSISNQKQEL